MTNLQRSPLVRHILRLHHEKEQLLLIAAIDDNNSSISAFITPNAFDMSSAEVSSYFAYGQVSRNTCPSGKKPLDKKGFVRLVSNLPIEMIEIEPEFISCIRDNEWVLNKVVKK
jgi:hypothetical protein